MVDEKDYFRKNMTEEEYRQALNDFVEACEEEGQQIPIWVRMQMDEEEITPPSPALKGVLSEIEEKYSKE